MTHKNLINFHGKMMINMAKELYPINRSITGEGVRKTLDLIKKKVPLKKSLLNLGKKYSIGQFQKSGILKKHIF